MRGILTAELQGAGLADLISPSRALVHEAIVRLRAEGSLRPEGAPSASTRSTCSPTSSSLPALTSPTSSTASS